MLLNLAIGALAVLMLAYLREYAHKKELSLTWWEWLLTALGVLYGVFVVELIAGFLGEGEPRAALVMGLITGLVAAIWGVLLARFVFSRVEE
jgi:hypothetical protein